MTARWTLGLVIAGLAMGCGKGAPAAIPDDVVVTRARAALAPFKTTLREELGRALQASPERAIDVCAQRAPELARSASRDGITVGRSAIKLRSPANAPRPWLGPVMDKLSKAPSGAEAVQVVSLPDGRRGYAEAIWMGPPCLTCHGEALAPSIADKLRERYPNDAARGFRIGELRGVFWAELEPSALRPAGVP